MIMSEIPDALKKAMAEGLCCSCEGPLEGSHVNFVQLMKVATWRFPVWGNVLVSDMGMRAMALACDNCVNPEKGTMKRKPKFALDLDGDEIRYHDVDSLEDARPITEELVNAALPSLAEAIGEEMIEISNIEINAKMLEQSEYYMMMVSEGYLRALRDPRDPQHQDFLRLLEIARRMEKKTLIVYEEETVSLQDLEQLQEEFMKGIVYECIPMDFEDRSDESTKKIADALKRMGLQQEREETG